MKGTPLDIIRQIRSMIRKLESIDLFLMISLGITGLFCCANLIEGGEFFDACVMNPESLFSDYFAHIAGASDRINMYSTAERFCFPPLAYVMYWGLWKMNPYTDPISILNYENYKAADNAMLVFLFYNIIVIIGLLYCIGEYYQKINIKYKLLLPLAIVFSYPVFCTSLQRGNSVFLVAVFISLAWFWIDSKSRIKNEAAMILIAVASGFKFYPAIIGLEYIKRKDYKKVFRLILYGIGAIFLPFIFFGGKKGFLSLVQHLIGLSGVGYSERVGTIRGMTEYLGVKYFHMEMDISHQWGIVMELIFLAICIFCFFKSEKKWQRMLFLSGILASFIASSFAYTIVYYLPSLLSFLKENPKIIKDSKKSAVLFGMNISLFGLIFSIPFFWIFIFNKGLYEGSFIAAYLLLLINGVEVLFCNKTKAISYGKD